MMQTFEYPNLIAGTDEWTDWWAPEVGEENRTFKIATIELPRPIAQDDVVCVSVDFEFDKLDMTGDEAIVIPQGAVDGSWRYFNPFTHAVEYARRDLFSSRPGVLDGETEVANAIHVDSFNYTTEPDSWVQSPVGHSKFGFGFRVDNCGGGRLRVRRLMVELSAEGAPHAWAPASGEVWP
jgi:hypothetical protein